VRMITFVNTVPISENKCINRWGPSAGCWLYTHAVTCSALSVADASTVLRCPGVRHVYSYLWANPVNNHRHRHIVDPCNVAEWLRGWVCSVMPCQRIMGAHVNLPFMFHAIALQVCAGCSAMPKQLRADMSTGLSC
jgi:hypothetical protein